MSPPTPERREVVVSIVPAHRGWVLQGLADHQRNLTRYLLVVFEGELFVIDGIYDGTDEAEAAREQVEQPHADLSDHKALNASDDHQAEQREKQHFERGASSAAVREHKRLLIGGRDLVKIGFQHLHFLRFDLRDDPQHVLVFHVLSF